MTRPLLCLLLLGASSMVAARDVRMHGANGDGGSCPEMTAEASAAPVLVKHAVVPSVRGKAKAPTTFRSGDDDAVHAPRWHSFLPGMFR